MKQCSRCNHLNSDMANYCGSCGASLDIDIDTVSGGASGVSQKTVESSKPQDVVFQNTVFQNTARERRKPRFSSVLKALAYVALFLTVQLIVSGSLSFIFNKMSELIYYGYVPYVDLRALYYSISDYVQLGICWLVLTVLTFFFLARHKNPAVELGFTKCPVKAVLLGAVFGYFVNIVLTFIISVIPWPESFFSDLSEKYDSVGAGGNLIITILSISVLTGLVEEIIFRRLVLTRLSRGFGVVFCCVFSAVIFGLVHGTPIAIFYAAVFGLFLAPICLKYDSVLPSAAAHMAFNLFGITALTPSDPILFFAYLSLSFALATLSYYFLMRRKPQTENKIRI